MSQSWGVVAFALGLAAVFTGCRARAVPLRESLGVVGAETGSVPTVAPPRSPGLQVVATFSILGDLVQHVGGRAIDLKVLVGPDGDAHAFEPNPSDGVVLAGADLVFENGLNFEPWLDDLYESSGSAARRVVVTDGLAPRSVGGSEYDPHMWQDVTAAQHMVGVIRDALAQADPENATIYRENATAYAAQLANLDKTIQAQAASLDPERRKLVTSHDALGYFASRYGFEIVATALGTATTETADPSAGDIARVVDQIRAVGVPAIFAENVAHSDLMERIAQEAGVTLVDSLYTDALGAPGTRPSAMRGTAGDTYVGMMSYNISQIVGALTP